MFLKKSWYTFGILLTLSSKLIIIGQTILWTTNTSIALSFTPIQIITSGKIATLGSGDKILHIVRMKYSKYLNLSESINATKDTIVLIAKPTNTTLKELKKGKISLVIVADDASENTKKLFKDKSSYRKINQIYFSTKVELGLAIGKSPRAVIGIRDKALASKITELM